MYVKERTNSSQRTRREIQKARALLPVGRHPPARRRRGAGRYERRERGERGYCPWEVYCQARGGGEGDEASVRRVRRGTAGAEGVTAAMRRKAGGTEVVRLTIASPCHATALGAFIISMLAGYG
jgi:hypothetical protein